jgi:peptidoglycan/xylan/chitin deacetylase (PgdA/CDA1 family)
MKDKKIFVTSSWDDVTNIDLKLSNLLETYKIKGTFFAVNNWIGTKISKEDVKHISDEFEIGAHTLNHVTLTKIQDVVAQKEICESKLALEKLLRKPVTSFAYPKGFYENKHVNMVR